MQPTVLNTDNLDRCIRTLESSLNYLRGTTADSIEHEMYRNSVVKGFELTLETAIKLLRKLLKAYGGNPKSIDELFFKDVLRQASLHSLITQEEVSRWFEYRENRNNTAHDYGVGFAYETLELMPAFLNDAKALAQKLAVKLREAAK